MLQTITTERLVLRPFDRATDRDALISLTSDADTMRYLGDGSAWTPAMVDDMLARHEAKYPFGHGFGAIVERRTGAFAGWAGVQNPKGWMAQLVDNPLPDDTIEIGWTLAPDFRGRGYATEAAAAWLTYGFEALELPEIIAVHTVGNDASERVMDRLGMVQRETMLLNDGDRLCLHTMGAATWSAR